MNANLGDKFFPRLTPAAADCLRRLQRLASARAAGLFLVGGSVRDLLMDRLNQDIDLALEGDAIGLAQEFAAEAGLDCLVHPAFHTATLRGEGFAFDLAMARREFYPRPGALPIVHPASIIDDLGRRDFSINALALPLNAEDAALIDPFQGQRDIEEGIVRVLHEQSFQDDATRILRAVRYAHRLHFRIEEQTLSWLHRDVAYLQTISADRLRYDFIRLLEEDAPEAALQMLSDLGALAQLHPSLAFDGALAAAFAKAREQPVVEPSPSLYLALLASRLSPGQVHELAERLSLNKGQRQIVEGVARLHQRAANFSPALSAAQIAEMLEPFPLEAIAAFALTTADATAASQSRHYLEVSRHLRTVLSGEDLLRLGVAPGPQVGKVLRELRSARINGQVRSRDEEIALVRKLTSPG
ncbi:MAG TPA: hypothetical protein VNL15_05875 [Dehalococcoidia bacterium]|nr:hypothetical protein [Dehalococcoidia bacterium]